MTFDEIIHCLSATDQKIIKDMMSLYEEIGRQTINFAGQTGLRCKVGCGACCETPEIETTVAEVLPLAVYLWSEGIAQNILETLRADPSQGVCALYQPEVSHKGNGRCGIYAYRPALCRLFGFAARSDKYGQKVLATCRVIKENQPELCQGTQEKLHNGLQAPLLSAHTFAVSNIDPVHGLTPLPINQAIRLALEKVGYNIQNNGC